MKLFLAGTSAFPWLFKEIIPMYVLESFYYIQDWQMVEIPKYKMFLLDSGAFTFMSGTHQGEIQWEQYIDEYADFYALADAAYSLCTEFLKGEENTNG